MGDVTEPALELEPPEKPRLRGRLHQGAFFASIPAVIALLLTARVALARVAVGIYGVSLIALYGTSTAYHRLARSERTRAVMRRLDHSMIFVLIAGTYTPFTLLALQPPWSYALLAVVWTGAITGILIKALAIDRFRALGFALYLVVGWAAVLAVPQLVGALETPQIVLMFVGGVLYTAGAIALATKRPNPFPRIFGYHEVFHLSTIIAGVCHYVSVMQIVLALH